MLEIISLFILAIIFLFIICSCIIAGAISRREEEEDIKIFISNKKIIDIHKDK